jgi:hypothetical protein
MSDQAFQPPMTNKAKTIAGTLSKLPPVYCYQDKSSFSIFFDIDTYMETKIRNMGNNEKLHL